MTKRFASLTALTLLLAACGPSTVKFSVAFNTKDPLRTAELTAAISRIVEGRLLAKKKTLVKQELLPEGETMTLTVTASDSEGAKHLTAGLTAPFTMEIMKQVESGQGDIISEKFGEFKETGITTKHFDWVTPGPTAVSDAPGAAAMAPGSVVISFTPEGEKLLKTMFAANRGSVIGIFVRGQLMSKKLIDASDKQTSIAIDGIPNPTLATAFSDDVNVGLHAVFTPVQ